MSSEASQRTLGAQLDQRFWSGREDAVDGSWKVASQHLPFGAGSSDSQLEALGFGNQRILTPEDVLAISRAVDGHLLANDFTFGGHDQPGAVLAGSLLVLRVAQAVHFGEDQLAFVVHAVADGPVVHPVVEEHVFLGGTGIEFNLGRFDDDATFGWREIRFIR